VEIEVLLIHPGGPFWTKKDSGAWSIPKGEIDEQENIISAARREFSEETGFDAKEPFFPLGSIIQKNGKVVHAWAFEGNCDPALAKSNTFRMEWPPGSGRVSEFPEADRAEFFGLEKAGEKINLAQIPFLDRLREFSNQL
jgi:predicted NUDIX family NTP pyrophosphohydrolase